MNKPSYQGSYQRKPPPPQFNKKPQYPKKNYQHHKNYPPKNNYHHQSNGKHYVLPPRFQKQYAVSVYNEANDNSVNNFHKVEAPEYNSGNTFMSKDNLPQRTITNDLSVYEEYQEPLQTTTREYEEPLQQTLNFSMPHSNGDSLMQGPKEIVENYCRERKLKSPTFRTLTMSDGRYVCSLTVCIIHVHYLSLVDNS